MAKVNHSWHCEICTTGFQTMELAEWCEKQHIGWRDLKLTGASYKPVTTSFYNTMQEVGLPYSIQVTWTDRNAHEKYATYTISQVGPTPV